MIYIYTHTPDTKRRKSRDMEDENKEQALPSPPAPSNPSDTKQQPTPTLTKKEKHAMPRGIYDRSASKKRGTGEAGLPQTENKYKKANPKFMTSEEISKAIVATRAKIKILSKEIKVSQKSLPGILVITILSPLIVLKIRLHSVAIS